MLIPMWILVAIPFVIGIFAAIVVAKPEGNYDFVSPILAIAVFLLGIIASLIVALVVYL